MSGTDNALALARMLLEHRGEDVVVMDLREMNTWTDFFVIATVSSSAHVQGLERHIREFVQEQGLEILRSRRKSAAAGDGWRLIDLGTIVIHLMSGQSRSFYELERLWASAPVIFQSGDMLENPTRVFQHAP